MCLAIPGKITKIDGEQATIDYDGVIKKANISLLDCAIGDFVLVHVGFAIEKIDEEKARQTYNLLYEADDE